MTASEALLTTAVAEHARRAPAHPALIQDGTVLSYGELEGRLDQVAAAAQASGLTPGDRVAICAPTSIDYVVLFLGLLRAGAVPVPLAPGVSAEALANMVKDSGARRVFATTEACETLRSQGVEVPIVGLGEGEWADWLSTAKGPADPVMIEETAPFNIIYSSGTTGAPKGIVQSHAMRATHMAAISGLFGPEAVTLISTPLYSNTTLVVLLPTLFSGGATVLMAKFDADEWLRLAERHGVTHTMLVPVQYRRLLDSPVFDTVDLTKFQLKFCTSAPFSAELKAETLKRWPGGLLEIFGMTEGGGACFLPAHLYPDKLHTVGQPMPGSDIRIIGEDGVQKSQGEIGEIVGRSGQMMDGYNNRPDQTAEAEWRSPQGDRFIRTGDLGRFDADGFLEIVGRSKDMIISGGFNLYPADLEAVLCAHADVAEAAVVGKADPRWGETPVGFVTPRPGACPDLDAVREWANARLGKNQRLSALVEVAELPRNAIGKIVKADLRRLLEA